MARIKWEDRKYNGYFKMEGIGGRGKTRTDKDRQRRLAVLGFRSYWRKLEFYRKSLLSRIGGRRGSDNDLYPELQEEALFSELRIMLDNLRSEVSSNSPGGVKHLLEMIEEIIRLISRVFHPSFQSMAPSLAVGTISSGSFPRGPPVSVGEVFNLDPKCKRTVGEVSNLDPKCKRTVGAVSNLDPKCKRTVGEVSNLDSGALAIGLEKPSHKGLAIGVTKPSHRAWQSGLEGPPTVCSGPENRIRTRPRISEILLKLNTILSRPNQAPFFGSEVKMPIFHNSLLYKAFKTLMNVITDWTEIIFSPLSHISPKAPRLGAYLTLEAMLDMTVMKFSAIMKEGLLGIK